MRALRPALLAVIASLLFASAFTGAALAQGLSLGNNDQPVDIYAEQGIEWHQDVSAYVARGNARAIRAGTTVYAQTLTAYHRKADVGQAAAASSTSNSGDIGGGSQIFRLDAEGAVRIVSESGTAYGDRAVYDVDKGILVMTGSNLRLVTERETITSRDTLEYWQQQDMAVARGNAVAVNDQQKRIAADLLTGYFTRQNQPSTGTTAAAKPAAPARPGTARTSTAQSSGGSDLDRIYAYGNVVITTPDEVARGDRGVYNTRTGIAVLTGNVKITRDQNQVNGDAAEMNMNTNVSRIIANPATSGVGAPPVRALLVPKDKNDGKSQGGSNPQGVRQ
jgi:lipopolysaccharide export system protein LptA